MPATQQSELTARQRAKLAAESGWKPRVTQRPTPANRPPVWRADWWERRTDEKPGYHHRQRQFATRQEADQWVISEQRKRIKQRRMTAKSERRGDSVVTLSHLSPAERAAIAQAVETIRKAGGRVEALADAARSFASVQLTGAKKTVREIVDEHLALLQKTKRPATVRDRRQNLKTFTERYGSELAGTINPATIDDWTMELPNQPTQAARWRAIRALFNYAVKRGYMDEPPTRRATPIASQTPDEIGVLSPPEVEELMSRAMKEGPSLVPYLAIGIFAGLRPENELGRLEWEKINLQSRKITVDGKNAKTKKKRAVPISENLAAWLEHTPSSRRKGKIYYSRRILRRILGQEQAARRARRNKLEAQASKAGRVLPGPRPSAKPAPKVLRWEQDIMRHTFGSYRQAIIQNISQLCEEMGNTPHIARAHYIDPPEEDQANKFWAITPSSVTENMDKNMLQSTIALPTSKRALSCTP
jgi:integrase